MKYHRSVLLPALAAIAIGSAGLVTSACSSAPPLPTYAMPASNDVKTLTFYLSQPKAGDEIIASANDAIQSALIRAEYRITTDENDPHDAVIDVDISANEKPAGFMTMQVNGRTVKDYAIHVSLSVRDGGNIVDQKAYDYTASGGQSETGNGFALVNDLSSSQRLRDWARKQVAKSAPPPKTTSTAVATKPTATAPARTPAPTTTTPSGPLGSGSSNPSGAAAGAATAGKGGTARDILGTGGPTAPPSASATGKGPDGGTAPY